LAFGANIEHVGRFLDEGHIGGGDEGDLGPTLLTILVPVRVIVGGVGWRWW
jgi:hypothetical protein